MGGEHKGVTRSLSGQADTKLEIPYGQWFQFSMGLPHWLRCPRFKLSPSVSPGATWTGAGMVYGPSRQPY